MNIKIAPSPTIEVADPAVLDADTRRMMARLEADPFLDTSMTIDQMRAGFEKFYAGMSADRKNKAVSSDREIPGRHGPIPLRIYTPAGTYSAPRPVLVFFHGGGSIMGSLNSYDAMCDELCTVSEAIVVSVAYRLAPEHPYSVQVEDCYDALTWTHVNADQLGAEPAKLAVGGESGGAGLAAIVTQMVREAGGPRIGFQLLIYPYVGTRGGSRSMVEFSRGFFFDADTLTWFSDLNFPDPAALKDWRVAPVWADSFADLPPAFVLTAGCDILRDDAEDYARRLSEAGVPVEVERYERTIHGFVMMGAWIEAGRRALHQCGEKVREAFQTPASRPERPPRPIATRV